MKSLPSVLIGEDDIKLKEAQKHLLRWGGMPFLLSIKKADERQKWLRDYTYTYLERDLADLSKLEDLEPFKKFQMLAALRDAKLLNYSELARNADISVDTSKRYLFGFKTNESRSRRSRQKRRQDRQDCGTGHLDDTVKAALWKLNKSDFSF